MSWGQFGSQKVAQLAKKHKKHFKKCSVCYRVSWEKQRQNCCCNLKQMDILPRKTTLSQTYLSPISKSASLKSENFLLKEQILFFQISSVWERFEFFIKAFQFFKSCFPWENMAEKFADAEIHLNFKGNEYTRFICLFLKERQLLWLLVCFPIQRSPSQKLSEKKGKTFAPLGQKGANPFLLDQIPVCKRAKQTRSVCHIRVSIPFY